MNNNSQKDKIIIIIRHGEKISDFYTDLNDRGKARAECLPILFSDKGLKYIPTKIYANQRSEESTRAYDTIAPLAKILNLEIEEFKKIEAEDFAKNKLIYDKSDIILISSSRKAIPKISKVLGHEVFVDFDEFDKYFIWKNGEFFCEGNQSDFIGKYIEEKEKKIKNINDKKFCHIY